MRWGAAMAIRGLLVNSAFDPARVKIMVEAYECACRELNLAAARIDPLTELIAFKILELTKDEVSPTPKAICERALRELGVLTH